MELRNNHSSNLCMPYSFADTIIKSWSRISKRKQTSLSNHHKTPFTLERGKNKAHTRQSSVIRKSKSKCETEANISGKKKNRENETVKKVRKKNKNAESSKLNTSKKDQFFSENDNKKWSRNMCFHSTYLSRMLDSDVENKNLHNTYSDYLHENNGEKSEYFGKIMEKTQQILNGYRKKCQDLNNMCSYYKDELEKQKRERGCSLKNKSLHVGKNNSSLQKRRSTKAKRKETVR